MTPSLIRRTTNARPRAVLWLALASGAAFLALTAAAGIGLTGWLERPVTEGLQLWPARWLDVAGSLYNLLGAVEVTGPAVFLLAALIWRRDRRLAIALIATFIIAQALGIALKRWLVHEGPPVDLARGGFPVRVASSNFRPGNSYPSGHALRLVFLLIMLGLLGLPPRVIAALWAAGSMLLALYVYLGAHWSTDIIGGILLAVSAATLAIWLAAPAAGRGPDSGDTRDAKPHPRPLPARRNREQRSRSSRSS